MHVAIGTKISTIYYHAGNSKKVMLCVSKALKPVATAEIGEVQDQSGLLYIRLSHLSHPLVYCNPILYLLSLA